MTAIITAVRRARELNHNWVSVDEDSDIYSSWVKPIPKIRSNGDGDWETPHIEEDEHHGTFYYPCKWTKAIFNVNNIKVI